MMLNVLETSWPSDDLKILIRNIKSCIPSNDTLNYIRRLKKISWNQVCILHCIDDIENFNLLMSNRF